ncbi:MAG: hypothetical protein QM790_05235 [Nibricoccus sp.]
MKIIRALFNCGVPDQPKETSVDVASLQRPARGRQYKWFWWGAAGLVLFVVLHGYVRCVLKYGDLTALIRFGSDFESVVVPTLREEKRVTFPGPGFDGQFYVQQSTDPLLRKPETQAALDNVTVRGRRVLFPAVAWLLSGGGHGRFLLWVYPQINLAAWLALGVMAWRTLRLENSVMAIVAFCAIVLGPGAIESASRALPDLPAFLLAFWAIGVPGITGALLLGLAGLGRETTLLAWPSRAGEVAQFRGNARKWLIDGAVAVAPLALWMLSLHFRFGGGGAGVDGGNLGTPFSGLGARVREIFTHLSARPVAGVGDFFLHPAVQCGFLVVAVLTQVVFLLKHRRIDDPLWRWGILSGILGLCLGWSTWEAFYTVTRHVLPMHLAFNVLLARSNSRSPWFWLLLGNLHVLPRVLFWLDFH